MTSRRPAVEDKVTNAFALDRRAVRLAAMKTGDRPRRDTGVVDDWGDNDPPCLLALREGAKLGDDQPLDLVFGLWDFFHNTYGHYGGGRRTDTASRRLFHSPG
jgi:hypothetical protein